MDDVFMRIERELSTQKYTEIIEFYKEHNRSTRSSFYLFSGRRSNEKIIKRGEVIDRKPKDTDPMIQKAFDRALIDLGFDALRSNSVFCTGSIKTASRYGNVYVVFPTNGFSITWSPVAYDLYEFLKGGLINLETLDLFRKEKEFIVVSPQGKKIIYMFWFINDKLTDFLYKLKEMNIKTRRNIRLYYTIQDVISDNPKIFDFTDREKHHLYKDFLEVLKYYAIPKKDVVMKDKDEYEKYYELFHDFIQRYYRKDNLYNAIKKKNEILVHAKGYFFIDSKLFMNNRDLILGFGMR